MAISHTIKSSRPADADCPKLISGAELADYGQYLTDESRRQGRAAALAFPRSTEELAAAVREAHRRGWEITASGARTGITAGAVPEGGLVISLERMNRVLDLRKLDDDTYAVSCEAGLTLSGLRQALKPGADSLANLTPASTKVFDAMHGRHFFFPPDPTETTASIGGIVACNASGAHTFRYGPTRPYVYGLKVVLADGSILELTRGDARADENGHFVLQRGTDEQVDVELPHYRQPVTKNAAGYFTEPGMDLVDLFIGSEGTLGIIAEVTLRLIRAPETSSAVMLFFAGEEEALDFVVKLRVRKNEMGVEAIEYFGPNALAFLRASRERTGVASGVPACLPPDAASGIYLDIGCAGHELPETLDKLAEIGEECGAAPEACWSAQDRGERERLRAFRHALPEAVNNRIAELQRECPDITKLGTDMAVPDECLKKIVALYRRELDRAGLEYVIFGHVGDNHLHVNILPHSATEYARGNKFYMEFAERAVAMGGSPAAEHGIGKLKREFLRLLVGEQGIEEMRRVKEAFDPDNLLGRGTLV